jgi:hypothetical protein
MFRKEMALELFSKILHQFVRHKIYEIGYVKAIRFFANETYFLFNTKRKNSLIKVKEIRKILSKIVEDDYNGRLVASCISISTLAHILCQISGIDSKVVIGVCVINGKLYSHAWLEVSDGEVMDFMSENREYKIIKRFDFNELLG